LNEAKAIIPEHETEVMTRVALQNAHSMEKDFCLHIAPKNAAIAIEKTAHE
jgi:hypothetical protein